MGLRFLSRLVVSLSRSRQCMVEKVRPWWLVSELHFVCLIGQDCQEEETEGRMKASQACQECQCRPSSSIVKDPKQIMGWSQDSPKSLVPCVDTLVGGVLPVKKINQAHLLRLEVSIGQTDEIGVTSRFFPKSYFHERNNANGCKERSWRSWRSVETCATQMPRCAQRKSLWGRHYCKETGKFEWGEPERMRCSPSVSAPRSEHKWIPPTLLA